ncbi:MAG: ABC transporter substrate-binding protein [Lachnospiraceae bacterium]|nr:ABC transporter substrate-binding protein [Lachnospiraceae bacterium]
MKKTLAVLLALCMVISMTACGKSSTDVGSQNSGKTDLVIAVDADVDTLHPADFSTTVEMDVLNQVYDTLMYMNPDGAHEPEPRIAESYEISADNMDYTFRLRKDVTFHDGTKLTASDVKFSLEMYMNSEYQGSQVTGLKSVDTPDDYTVVCHLENPYSPFMLGICSVHIASKAYYEKSAEEFANTPVGSGPYKYVGRNKGSNITLEAYDKYYRGEASIKKVTFEVIPDQSTMAIALQTGDVHFANIQSSSMTQLQADKNITIAEVSTSGFAYVSMNTEKAPFDNVKVRQAINYAINRENLVQVCFDGEAEVNSNICSKSRFGYSDEQFQYTYDPEKAKSLLAEAGIATPYDLGELLVAEKYSNLATVIQNDLKAVGLNVTIAVKEFNAYIGELTSGNYSITALNMTLEGDTQMLEMALTSDYIGTANNARYSDAQMDELFRQAQAETDTDKRAAIFNQIFTKAQDEAVYAILGNPLNLYAYNSALKCPEIPFEGLYSIYDFSW